MEPNRYLVEDVLKNGTPVIIRAVRPDDRQRIEDAFGKLAPETVYLRFFGQKKALSDSELRRLTEIDFEREVGLVVTTGTGAGERVIAAARYVRADDAGRADAAEVAFTVEEDFQGAGIGGRLLKHLAAIGRERGIARFEAEVLAENQGMLAVFARSGLPMQKRREGGVVHVALELDGKRAAAESGRQENGGQGA
jgi:RimJ/RimL family protein N-acetyltransferase